MNPNSTARIYDPERNPDRAFLPGIPLRDLTVAEWRALPRWLRHSVDACGFYHRPPRRPARKVAGPSETKEA